MKERIIELIRECCAITEDNITEETKIKEISLDSLSFVQLAINLGNEFNFEFDDEDLNIYKFEKVSDIIELINKKTA